MNIATKLLKASAGQAVGQGLDVDEVFSTFLYTGTGSNQTIQNGIDLTEGGVVWIKSRGAHNHNLHDSATGVTCSLRVNGTNAKYCDATQISAFTSNGFTVGTDGSSNTNSRNYVSWTFRKAPKFFDIVTYTGNGSNQNISHNLGTTPGFVMVKKTSGSGNWSGWHRSLASANPDHYILLNSTSAAINGGGAYNRTVNSTTYQIFGDYPDEGSNGQSYTMFLFAHNDDDGEFGSSGDQDIIKCGSYQNNSSDDVTINLGFEPQFLFIKNTSDTADFIILDIMRGIVHDSGTARSPELIPNAASAESNTNAILPDSTGFIARSGVDLRYNSGATTGSKTYIYMAISRSTKVPTASSQVFSEHFGDGDHTTNFPVDMNINTQNISNSINYIFNRLTHPNILRTNSSDPEDTFGPANFFQSNSGTDVGTGWWGLSQTNIVSLSWKRAQTYFDIVCYTAGSSPSGGETITHNLKAVPEMMWIKRRNGSETMVVYHEGLGNTKFLELDGTAAAATSSTHFNDTTPTDSVFTIGTSNNVNASSSPYIAFLFATVAGVSKVGIVTHSSGSATNVDCGFSSGSKFIILKRTDSTGKWYAFFTAIGGVVAGNDTYLELNTKNVLVTSEDVVDPLSSGFQIASGTTSGTYIFYAIAA